jgi:putative DNA primase/helicase
MTDDLNDTLQSKGVEAVRDRLGRAKPSPPKRAAQTTDLLDEQTVMRQFVEEYRDQLRYNHTSRRWLVWQKHYWKVDGKDLAFSWALALCRKLPPGTVHRKIRFARAIEEGARAQPEFATEQEEWDRDPWLLGTPGGVVDLRTGELRDGAPGDYISRISSVTPAPTADCPKWIAFLNYALDDKQDNIAFFQRYCGYCHTGLTREETLLFLSGKEGTGKGTATKTITGTMGDLATSIPVAMFSNAAWNKLEYYRAQLVGFRLALASEPEKDAVLSEAFVNELTGGDRLNGRHPSGRPFDFDPIHKLLISGNSIPDLKGMATGLKRRLAIMEFNRPPAIVNKTLKDELRAEYPGILRWSIDGCLAWQQRGLDPPTDVQVAVKDYFDRQDIIGRWIEDSCSVVPTAEMTPNDLRASYNEWAAGNGENAMTSKEFHKAIEHYGVAGIKQGKTNGKRWVRGILVNPKQNNQ